MSVTQSLIDKTILPKLRSGKSVLHLIDKKSIPNGDFLLDIEKDLNLVINKLETYLQTNFLEEK